MKTIKLTFLFLFFPLIFFAQTLTGLWIGSVSNDSTTIRKDQSFEIVLTQYKDKVYGFSRSTFVVNDSLFYIVKRVKGTIDGDMCEVKDDEIVSYNFKGRLDKGVKMVSFFHFDQQDSVWKMDGDWKTNKTKKYYSVSGKIELAQEKDLDKSKIFPHLEELNLANDVAFYKEAKKTSEPVAIIKQPVNDNKIDQVKKDIRPPVASTEEMKAKEVAVIPPKTEPVAQTKQPTTTIKKVELPVEEKTIVAAEKNDRGDSAVFVQAKYNPEKSQLTSDGRKETVIKEIKSPEKQEPKKSEPVVTTKPVEQKKEPVIEPAITETKKQEIVSASIIDKEKDKPQPAATIREVKPAIPRAALEVATRKLPPPQIVNFKSDSLELALYDNGEVDGDTVSVLLNGEIILAKQGLKASAIKKTIYVPAGNDDSLILVLYAENLGKYPPNTGLLIVHDGDDTYQVRFSADLQQNAAVIFKRKKK